MLELTNLLNFVPKPVAAGVVIFVLGGGAVVGMEMRYMTVAEFTKSYVLDLKSEIRDLRDDLKDAETERERRLIQEDIDRLIDELCEERPDDRMCESGSA